MKKYGLMKAILETKKADKMTNEERLNLQQKRLRELISYAKSNSPYYAKLYKNCDENTPLEQLPTTNKIEMMSHFDEWFTDRAITRKKVDEFMSDISNVGKKLDGKYLVYSTSGSTGNPCIVLYDDTVNNVASAIGVLRSFARSEDMKRFMKHGGKTVALFADNGFYLGSGSVKYNLRKMPWKKKKMMTCEVRDSADIINKRLNEFQPSMIGCYPTALELLADEQDAGRLNINPAIIMAGGEYLSDETRERLAKSFNCYVQTNYSCTEGGTVACECTERHFHVNDDWIILEAVDENNKPVPFGTQSAKVLMTNLSNKVCPFIRFEITDRITMYNTPCKCGNTRPWLTLEGRTDDILTFDNGVKVAPLSLYAILKEVHEISRFQLIQHDNNRLELRMITENPQVAFDKAKQEVEKYLKKNGVTADVFYSSEEPKTHPISGKFKHIIAKPVEKKVAHK